MGSPCQRGDARGERLRRGWAAERAGPRGCGPRVGAGRSWAAEGVGFGLVPGEGKRPGEEWVRFWVLFWVFPFYFYLLSHFKSKSNKG